MRQFFKFFLAALLALIFFTVIGFFFLMGMIGGVAQQAAVPVTVSNAVLQIDLSHAYIEQPDYNFRKAIIANGKKPLPSLYEVVQAIKKAKLDDNIKGIELIANSNANGFASSQEIRNALIEFKGNKKFVVAYADVMTQGAYSIANVANKVYVNPQGGFEWKGFGVNYIFFKGLIDKLQIAPQIFYAGKFKSATEPFRVEKMTPENKLQTAAWLNDLYQYFISQTSASRSLDTASLRLWANTGEIQKTQDAVDKKLIDGAKYNDELRSEIKKLLAIKEDAAINYVAIEDYVSPALGSGSGQSVALLYASGDIVDGEGEVSQIGSDTYIKLLREAREDANIKAIVVRVNSGGGSALASENIWREMVLAKKVKPVIVSFGDVAASGGYYMACAADSIFAQPNTITGSIGVFGIIPDMSAFLKNKMGVTFDEVQTSPLANSPSATRPMNDMEKKRIQASIEDIYNQFKKRVAEGRNRDTAYVDSIAQGRVWSGIQAKEIGLVDAFGGLSDAIAAAAKKANLNDYRVEEFPRKKTWIEQLLNVKTGTEVQVAVKERLGAENYLIYKQMLDIQHLCNKPQARIPFQYIFN